ncbi:hypothetical protein RCS94_00875 [Orbaceae bacterium ac157xtp]
MSKTKQYVEEALCLQEDEDSTLPQVIEKYEQAIAVHVDGDDDEYEFLYAHYQLMWIYGNHNMIEKAQVYAQKCMGLLDDTLQAGAIMHFTDMGQFYEEVIRFSTNTIAWFTYLNSEDNAELEKALEAITLGCEYADDPTYYYAFDTKVRILLKLGRKEEAFQIVYKCLKKEPGFSDFSDIKVDPEYKAWKQKLTSGNLSYSDSEKAFLEKAKRNTAKLKSLVDEKENFTKQFKEQIPEKVLLQVKELKTKYKIPEGWYGDDDYLLLFKGDVRINGNVDEEWYDKQLEGMMWDNELYGIIVDGNLEINGDLTLDVNVFLIEKDLTCDYLHSQEGHMVIHGNAYARFAIYGEYNGGSLAVSNEVFTPYIVGNDHEMPFYSVQADSIYLECGPCTDLSEVCVGEEFDPEDNCWDCFEDPEKLLSPAVEDEEGFSHDLFFEIVKRGENPFRF